MKNTIIVNGRRKTCRIYDLGAESGVADHYTVAFRGHFVKGWGMVYPYLAAGPCPFHPQGFGQHGESREFLKGRHLGKRVTFESVPADVQRFILQSI